MPEISRFPGIVIQMYYSVQQGCYVANQQPLRPVFDDRILNVTGAKYRGDYRVWLEFSDGTSGDVDLSERLHGEVFEPLKDVGFFSQVRFDPQMHTIVWPNGADLAPEYLKDLVLHQSAAAVKAS